MRKTIRPVTLSRIVETVDICNKDSPVEPDTVRESLDLSEQRTNEIVSELDRLSIVQEENGLSLTERGVNLHDAVMRDDWDDVHDFLYEASPHYNVFIDALRSHGGESGLTQEQLLTELEEKDHPLRFNKTGISLLTDWGERLQAVQQNVFESRYYSILEPRNEEPFVNVLEDTYEEMEITRGLGMRQRYISIPKLREYICESLRLPRDGFDERLISVAQEYIGKLELSGAPLDTQAKESRLGIKTIQRSKEEGIVTTSMTSDRVLAGITMPDGKTYYYLTIFEQLMEGETR